ncbi:biosynthetic-type acetolactate synthase large subunit [uncultured Enterococcus sp.]|uniref:biosynthetic-type acetolactate synthase large subunit n=1 Tax=uncultured Enterococcus sp. TaxID=167972 RepID=UPI002803E146|nr:biosynthetic-type acetolactate synthase large subunit [uncultured Enterococcus sp.]
MASPQKNAIVAEKFSGAKLLLDCLAKQDVEIIFGYPGGAVLPLYDALYHANIPNILTRHEQGAVHAAQGYAKSTGKPGVVIVTSGPGATNVVTGIADAMSDSVPLVVIIGQVVTEGIGKDAFQEADILGITLPITKNNYQVRNVHDLPKILNEAFHIATTGRKGPVVIDLPKDMTVYQASVPPAREICLESYHPNTQPSPIQIKHLLEKLAEAKRPVILAGGGVVAAQAAAELTDFAEKYQIPTVASLLGLGVVSSDHDLFLGMAGMHGSYAANMALVDCDLLINIGCRFSDRLATSPTSFAQDTTVVHVDIDPAEIGKIIPTAIPIVADAKQTLLAMLNKEIVTKDTTEWQALCQKRKQEKPFTYNRQDNSEIKPQKVIELVGDLTKGNAIVATDVGQHQMWVAQYYPFKFANQLITSGGLGTMGYGIPAGIGAKFGNPSKQIVVFVGDGGFQMTNQELAILNEHQLDIKFILLNNSSLGMVRQWQEVFFDNRRSQSVFKHSPDFVMLAKAYGIEADRISNPKTMEADFTAAFNKPGPGLIEVIVSPTEHVLPMIPPGNANDQMIGVD